MTKLDNKMYLELNYYTPAMLVEFAARFSWLSHHLMTGESYEQFLSNLEGHGHKSPKLCSLVVFTGHNFDRALTHQIVVHAKNIGKSQESQRYVKQSQSTFYEHPNIDHKKVYSLGKDGSMNLSVAELYELNRLMYVELLKDKVKKEDARRVLPNAIGQSICMWGSIADWQSFCGARMNPAAETPIRSFACAAFERLVELYPSCFDHEKYWNIYNKGKEKGVFEVVNTVKPIKEYEGFWHDKKKKS